MKTAVMKTAVMKAALTKQWHCRALMVFLALLTPIRTLATVDPMAARPLGQDPLSIYQWGLKNQGQEIIQDITDIKSIRIRGVQGMDIGLTPSKWAAVQAKMDRPALIALLDTGVSIDHPELKDSIARNALECDGDSFLPADPALDRDGNGFKGDCAGWNFTTPVAGGDARALDDVGHGTHLAGIWAARADNGLGVRGLSQNIQILPIKVLSKDEGGRDPKSRPALSLSDRIAAGIRYAMLRKVDLIHLSLGWPRAFDTEALRSSIRAAVRSGIVVIAAAGNNSHEGLVFPCAYAEVICVGAVGIDGAKAAFSNLGGSVDLMAPGDRILSTIPLKIASTYFKIPGYDYRDGTSQAAPFVSGALAVLKRAYLNENQDQLLARLQSTAKPSKVSSFGLIQIDQAAEAPAVPHVVPVWKELQDIEFDPATGNFEFTAPVANLWAKSGAVTLQVSIEGKSVQLEQSKIAFHSLGAGERTQISIRGKLQDLTAHAQSEVKLEVAVSGLPLRIFRKKIQWVRRLRLGTDAIERKLTYQAAEPVLGRLTPRGIQPLVFTVSEPGTPSNDTLQYVSVPNKEAVELRLFKSSAGVMSELGQWIRPGAERLLEVYRLDVDGQGNKDLVTVTLERTSNEKEPQQIVYCFQKEDGRPLYRESGNSCFAFRPEVAVPHPRHLRWLETYSKGRRYLFPAFVEIAKLPALDLPSNEWDREPNIPTTRLFRLEPFGDQQVRERNVTVLPVTESHRLLPLLPQTESDLKQGRVRGLVSIGRGITKKVQTFEVKSGGGVQIASGAMTSSERGAMIEGLQVENSLEITQNQVRLGSRFALAGIVDETRGYRFWIQQAESLNSVQEQKFNSFEYQQDFDSLMAPLASFVDGAEHFEVFQSKVQNLLQVVDSNGKRSFAEPLERYSFIPGSMFSELFFSMAVMFDGKLRPALYIDQSQIQSRRLSVALLDGQKGFIRPALLNIALPEGCRVLNPSLDGLRGGYQLSLLCLDSVGRGKIYDVPLASGGTVTR